MDDAGNDALNTTAAELSETMRIHGDAALTGRTPEEVMAQMVEHVEATTNPPFDAAVRLRDWLETGREVRDMPQLTSQAEGDMLALIEYVATAETIRRAILDSGLRLEHTRPKSVMAFLTDHGQRAQEAAARLTMGFTPLTDPRPSQS